MLELIDTKFLREIFDTTGELHEEISENGEIYVLDAHKDDNKLVISLEKKENQDKKEFESWVDKLDDEIFEETWNSLANESSLHDLNKSYNGENYKEVIRLFKEKANDILTQRINHLQELLGE